MQVDRGKTEKAFGPMKPPNGFSDMNTRGTGIGGDPIFADPFTQKPKGQYPSKHICGNSDAFNYFITGINDYTILICIIEIDDSGL